MKRGQRELFFGGQGKKLAAAGQFSAQGPLTREGKMWYSKFTSLQVYFFVPIFRSEKRPCTQKEEGGKPAPAQRGSGAR